MKNRLIVRGRSVHASACAMMALAVCAGSLYAADSAVPAEWNVAPMRAGASLESFESTLPTWAGRTGSSSVTAVFPTMQTSDLPLRSNDWFDASLQVMELATDGSVLTNALEKSGPGPVDFENEPVYVDMRVRFDAMSEEPDAATLASCKLAIYLSDDAKLVVVHGGGVTTNSTVLDTNKWYQVSARLEDGGCDLKLNDVPILTTLALQSAGTANQLEAVSFKGSGFIDELYVSYGAPDYAVAGPTTAIPSLPANGSNIPTDEQQTLINLYLSEQTALTAVNMTQDELSQAYLIDAALTGAADPVAYSFGISAIDLVTPTNLKITAKLTVATVLKSGAINGRIQLQGKVNKGDTWTTFAGAITPGQAEFVDGEAVYFFTVPAGGYKFFKSTIIP